MISNGPLGRRAIVKWKPATKVFAGVYLVVLKKAQIYKNIHDLKHERKR